ncbi:MAG: hypothetical protein P8H03_02640 [Emcibacteraceae bacterium]|nr:hypothetical protein [Emcibacteraceae bacterium]MDG1858909.1 hypothetical protein [Emcibacteraceae bacterium]
MSKNIPDSELFEAIESNIESMPTDSANEIALLLLFAEYAAHAHPFSAIPKSDQEKAIVLQSKISNVVNDLSKSERDRLAPLIRGVQLIKFLSE